MAEEKAKENLICDHAILCTLFTEIEGQLLLWHSASATGGTYLKAIVSTCKKINTLTNTPPPPSLSSSSSPFSLPSPNDISALCQDIDSLSLSPPSPSSPSSSFSLHSSPFAIHGEKRESVWGVLAGKRGRETLPSKMLNEQLRAYDALMSSLLSKYDILELISKKIYELAEKCQCVLRALLPSPSPPSSLSTSLFTETFPPPIPNQNRTSSSSSFSLSSSSSPSLKIPLPPPHYIPSFAIHSPQWLCISPKNKRIKGRKRPTSFSSPSVSGGGGGGRGGGGRGGGEEEEEDERFLLLPALKDYFGLLEETLEYVRTHSLQKLFVKESLSYFMENKTAEVHLETWMESEKEWETFEKRFSDITELIEED